MVDNETNINKLKEVALDFLELDPTPVEKFPFLVIHPYFEDRISGIQVVLPDGTHDIKTFDILEDAEAFEQRKSFIRERIKAGDLDTIFAHMLPKYYLAFLKFSKPYMSKKDFETYLAYSWVQAENPNQDNNVDIPTLIEWFSKSNPKNLMDEKELNYYNSLPNEVPIYRGIAVGRAEQEGLSWTCNRKTAEWFAHRFDIYDRKGYLLKGVIDKKDIFAYFNSRDEDEICCNSRKVRNVEREEL